ncbi:SseB family protein [Nocardioides litoris]|uniref:SseB family protein n=1 Tax=Nocardioides litoris TaxID=1926648 RepID=UPI001FE4F4FE|nr:SseB family protein [Nocardioides litoris]
MPDRDLLAPAYPDDDGSADAALTAALTAHAADRMLLPQALGALQDARLLVPVVAVADEVEVDEQGLAREKSSDMAAVLVQGPGGRRGLLAFTATTTMAAWDPAARPVPVPARTAALAAVQDGADALLVDLAGPASLVVEGDHLRALAAGWRLVRIGDDHGWVEPTPS